MQTQDDILASRMQEAMEELKRRGLAFNQKDVYAAMQIDKSSASKFFSGNKSYHNPRRVRAFNSTFGGIFNEEYLLGEEGELLKDPEGVDRSIGDGKVEGLFLTEKNSVIYYPNLVVTGSEIDGFSDNELHQDRQMWRVPGLEGCTAFPLEGESMSPTIPAGAIVAHQPWVERFIENGELYVIVTRSGHRMTKRLVLDGYDEDGAMILTCMSDHEDQRKYKPFSLNGNDIVYIGRVKGVINMTIYR